MLLPACADDAVGTDDKNGVDTQVTAGAFDEIEARLNGEVTTVEARQLLLDNFILVIDEATGMVDREAGLQYARLARELAAKAPNDTLVALPLYKSADVHKALNDYRSAAMIFERVHRDYPTFSKAGEALFMLGFTYDENLKDFDKAREVYTKFLTEFPDNVFARDTKVLLENLGKSDAEVLERMQQPNE